MTGVRRAVGAYEGGLGGGSDSQSGLCAAVGPNRPVVSGEGVSLTVRSVLSTAH